MACLIESMEKLVRNPLITAWKQFLLGVLLISCSYCQMWLSIVDRILHHDSGEKDLIWKEKRPRRRVQENTESLELESLSHRFSLVYPLQSDPVQPGNCLPCTVCSQVQGCIYPTRGDWVCAVPPEGPCITENPRSKYPAQCSQSSQAETGKQRAAADW